MAEQAGISEEHLAFYAKCRKDPWFFLTTCVYTQDQVDSDNPIKPFPVHLDYLKLFTQIFTRRKLIAVPKSRRMTMSWTCIALILWDVIFNRGKMWAFVSMKEEHSAELVSRAKFIFDHIPRTKIPEALLPKLEGGKMLKSPPQLNFPEINSKLQGFPMGADQLRQFTFSGILGDECAFWPEAQKFYSAAKPTIDGGGTMILVSSRAPGFFKKIVFDQIDNPSYAFPEVAPGKLKHPLEGVEVSENPKNKFLIFDLHYTANPEKRGDAFRESVRQSMPVREFLMEYEKNWDTFEGMPVFPDFRKDIHIAKHREEPHLGLPLLCGLDFGLSPALVVGQLRGQRLLVFREFTAMNRGIKQFLEDVMPRLQQEFPEWDIRSQKDYHFFIDPAGFQKSQVDARTCVQQMNELGLRNITPGPIDWESRRTSVEQFLLHVDREGYGLSLNASECPTLIEAFQGGYRYPDSAGEIEPQKIRPIKDRFSHCSDALQYLCGGVRRKRLVKTTTPDAPYYGFINNDQTQGDENAKKHGLGRKIY